MVNFCSIEFHNIAYLKVVHSAKQHVKNAIRNALSLWNFRVSILVENQSEHVVKDF